MHVQEMPTENSYNKIYKKQFWGNMYLHLVLTKITDLVDLQDNF